MRRKLSQDPKDWDPGFNSVTGIVLLAKLRILAAICDSLSARR